MGDDGSITVRCACGWQTFGPEEEVVAATMEHGRRLHNMVPSRDEVLEMAVDASGRVDGDDAVESGSRG